MIQYSCYASSFLHYHCTQNPLHFLRYHCRTTHFTFSAIIAHKIHTLFRKPESPIYQWQLDINGTKCCIIQYSRQYFIDTIGIHYQIYPRKNKQHTKHRIISHHLNFHHTTHLEQTMHKHNTLIITHHHHHIP